MLPFYQDLLERLGSLHSDIELAIADLPPEALDWSPGPEMNSISVLIVHLTGAERYWIGDVACGLRSDRDRDAEFQTVGLTADLLRTRLRDSLAHARDAMDHLTLADLEEARPSWRDGNTYRVGWALAHALEHTALHAGHVQIQRQMWEQRADEPSCRS